MTIAVLDFGGQYTHLITQRIRKLGVYAAIENPDLSTVTANEYTGIILSGGPDSVLSINCIDYNHQIFDLQIPILGICYGHQLICKHFGAKINKGRTTEYGSATLSLKEPDNPNLVNTINGQVWMSHSDTVEELPNCLWASASTENCEIAAVQHLSKRIYGVQFHPEVKHTPDGDKLFEKFLQICNCKFGWSMENYLDYSISKIQKQCDNKSVFMLLSGGVDSTVAFTLLTRALGDRVLGLHIDNGFMRYKESEQVVQALKIKNLCVVDASAQFYEALENVVDPQEKRKIVGNLFLDVQQQELERLGLGEEWLLGQGTIYPDTIESGATKHSNVIKTHHNRVDRVQELIAAGKIIEPIVDLYKDEVREIGTLLGLPKDLIWRHPFPGPGLSIRILCNLGNGTNLDVLEYKINKFISHTGLRALPLPIKSVGVQGDARTFAHPVLLCGKTDWNNIAKISTAITNHFSEINRVLWCEKVWKRAYLTNATMNKKRIEKLQSVDHLVTQFLHDKKLYDKFWQCPVVLIPCSSEPNEESIVLRPVESTEAMTANFARMDFETLQELNNKLSYNVLYDVTNKPPGTIEWE